MLNALAARLGRDVRASSAGSTPSGRINAFPFEALNNAGIDTSATCRSKSWGEFSLDGAPPLSLVITGLRSAAADTYGVLRRERWTRRSAGQGAR